MPYLFVSVVISDSNVIPNFLNVPKQNHHVLVTAFIYKYTYIFMQINKERKLPFLPILMSSKFLSDSN